MAITTTEQAVAAIQQFAEGTALLTTVTELAEFFKQTVFVSVGGRNTEGGMSEAYLVGTKVRDQVGTKSLRFTTEAMLVDVTTEFKIPKVLIVAVIGVSELTITPKKTFDIGSGSILFPHETKMCTQLDLDNPHARIVLTTQLSGCAFAIGSKDNLVYMGHVQPNNDLNGEELAKGLGKGKIFEGLKL